jgi:hypothetical protein
MQQEQQGGFLSFGAMTLETGRKRTLIYPLTGLGKQSTSDRQL